MRVVSGDTPTSDGLQTPLATAVAVPAPGVRAARLRLPGPPTQEEIAARMNVSLHTYRRWDQGKNKPQTPELMQLLSTVLKTPLEVIWPPEANPQVAVALKGERDRAAQRLPLDPEPAPELDDRLSPGATDAEADNGPDLTTETDPQAPPAQPATGPLAPSALLTVPADTAPDVPPWDDPPVPLMPPPAGPAIPDVHDVLRVIDGPRPRQGPRLPRPIVAVVGVLAALAVGAAVAIAGADRNPNASLSTGAHPSASIAPAPAPEDPTEIAMHQAAQRHDYDAAIALAQTRNDTAAEERYATAAAQVLVARAARAAHRGDLTLAQTRLRRASARYHHTPGGPQVRRTIARIRHDRTTRAARQRARARSQTTTPSHAAQARRVSTPTTTAAATSATPKAAAPVSPSPASTPTPSSATPSPHRSTGGSSSAKRSRSGGEFDYLGQ